MTENPTDNELDKNPEPKEPILTIDFKVNEVKVEPLTDEPTSGRKKSAYSLFLGQCLPKKPSDVPTSEYLGLCNNLWKDIPEKEKEGLQKLAESLNNPEEEE